MEPGVSYTLKPSQLWVLLHLALSLFVGYLGLSVAGEPGVLLGALLALSILRYRLTLDVDRVHVQFTFYSRSLRYADILGYRIEQHRNYSYLVLIPLDASRERLRIALLFPQNQAFKAWIEGLKNLDAWDHLRSLRKIKQNPAFGTNPNARTRNLARATAVTRALTVAAFVILIANQFLKHPLFGMAFVVVPWLLVLLVYASRHLIRLDQYRYTAHPSLVYCLGLLLTGMTASTGSLNFGTDSALLIPIAFIIGLPLFGAILTARKPDPLNRIHWTLIMVASGLYGYGAGAHMNMFLDRSEPQSFSATVKGGRVSGGRTLSYRLILGPWGPYKQATSVQVSRALYDQAEVGSRLCIQGRPGALGIPWYQVDDCW